MHLFRRRASVRRSKKRPQALTYRGFTLPALYRRRKKGVADDAVPAAADAPPPPVRPERKKKKLREQLAAGSGAGAAAGTLWPLPTQVHPEYPSTMLKAYREECRHALLGLRRPSTPARPHPQAVFYTPTPAGVSRASGSPSPPPSPRPSTGGSPRLTAREHFLRASRSRARPGRRWSTTGSVLKFRGVPRPTLIRRARSGQGRQGRAATPSPTRGLGLGLGAAAALAIALGLDSSGSSSSSSGACSCACSCCSCCSRCPCEPEGAAAEEDDIRPLVWPVSRLMAQRGAGGAVDFPPVRPACRKDPALRQRAPPARLVESPAPSPSPEPIRAPAALRLPPTPAPRLSLVGLHPSDAVAEPAQVVMRRRQGERPVPMKRYSLTELGSQPPQASPTFKRHSLHLPDTDAAAAPARETPTPPPTLETPPPERAPSPPPPTNRHSMIELGDLESEALSQRRPSTRVLPLWSANKYSTIARIRVPHSSPPGQRAEEEDAARRTQTIGRRRPRRDHVLDTYDLETTWRRPPPVPPASAKPRITVATPPPAKQAVPPPALPLAPTVLRVALQGGPAVPRPVRPAPRVAAVEPQRRLTTAIGISMAPGQRATTRITEVQPSPPPQPPRLAAKPPPGPARPSPSSPCEGPALPPRPPKGLLAVRPAPANGPAKGRVAARSKSAERLAVGPPCPCPAPGGRARC
ncbi:Muscle M-line assembly protein unc-89 [Frankliniella fusca]|uniref:Muscle M-line assembly protein unc-89 n=1 Tax=Frankliniella fusca TaxID=407009 RepID=A0AAE1GYQ9_9NEOP|nr:Muscle M-line assembly protein unc-89 [Frankliniella fusca]